MICKSYQLVIRTVNELLQLTQTHMHVHVIDLQILSITTGNRHDSQ